MARLKFDGTKLKDGAKTLANVSGSSIREGSSVKTIMNISGDNIRQGSGVSTIANVKGDDIRQGSGISKIGTMKDVDKEIEGPGKIIKAALWFYFCR